MYGIPLLIDGQIRCQIDALSNYYHYKDACIYLHSQKNKNKNNKVMKLRFLNSANLIVFLLPSSSTSRLINQPNQSNQLTD